MLFLHEGAVPQLQTVDLPQFRQHRRLECELIRERVRSSHTPTRETFRPPEGLLGWLQDSRARAQESLCTDVCSILNLRKELRNGHCLEETEGLICMTLTPDGNYLAGRASCQGDLLTIETRSRVIQR